MFVSECDTTRPLWTTKKCVNIFSSDSNIEEIGAVFNLGFPNSQPDYTVLPHGAYFSLYSSETTRNPSCYVNPLETMHFCVIIAKRSDLSNF